MTIFFLLALVALTVAALMVVPLPAAAGAIDTFIAAASP